MPSRHGTQGFVMDPGCGLGVRFLGGRPCVPGWAALSGSPFCNPPPHVKGFSWKGARGPIGWVGNGAGHMELGWEEPSGMASLENAPNTLSLGTGSEYLQGQHHVHCWPPHNTAQDRTTVHTAAVAPVHIQRTFDHIIARPVAVWIQCCKQLSCFVIHCAVRMLHCGCNRQKQSRSRRPTSSQSWPATVGQKGVSAPSLVASLPQIKKAVLHFPVCSFSASEGPRSASAMHTDNAGAPGSPALPGGMLEGLKSVMRCTPCGWPRMDQSATPNLWPSSHVCSPHNGTAGQPPQRWLQGAGAVRPEGRRHTAPPTGALILLSWGHGHLSSWLLQLAASMAGPCPVSWNQPAQMAWQ